MKRIVLFLLISVTTMFVAMDNPTPKSHLPMEELPEELQLEVLKWIGAGNSVKEVVDNIRNSRLVSKDFNRLLSDKVLTTWLLDKLGNVVKEEMEEKYPGSGELVSDEGLMIIAALYLNTPQAIEFVKAFLAKDKAGALEFLDDVLIGIAIPEKNIAMLNTLLALGVNPNATAHMIKWIESGQTALHIAIGRGFVAGVQALLAKGADANNRGIAFSPLYEAVELNAANPTNYEEIMRSLIKKGANPDGSLEDGLTPLMNAIIRGRASLVKILLDAGANVNLRRVLHTALDLAVELNHQEIIKLLVEKGAQRAADLQP